MIKIAGLFTGKEAEFFPNGAPSSIRRNTPLEKLVILKSHIKGNTITNMKHHGGDDRVVHQYPLEHYDKWKKEFPGKREKLSPGSIGENICSLGLLENEISLGDQVQIGSVVLEVSEPRTPCGTIDRNYSIPKFSRLIAESSRCGWMYRVIGPGEFSVKDTFIHQKKGGLDFSITNVLQKGYFKPDLGYIAELLSHPSLGEKFKKGLEKYREKLS